MLQVDFGLRRAARGIWFAENGWQLVARGNKMKFDAFPPSSSAAGRIRQPKDEAMEEKFHPLIDKYNRRQIGFPGDRNALPPICRPLPVALIT
jgi:hypothetical protein